MNKVKDLSDAEKRQLLKQLLARNEKKTERVLNPVRSAGSTDDPTSFNDFAGFKMLQEQAEIFQTLVLKNPYFCVHEGISDHVTDFEGKKYINYSGYNYLGLSGHPEVSAAAKNAIDQYGTSVSASRIVSGEIPLHAELEQALAEIHDTEAAVALVISD